MTLAAFEQKFHTSINMIQLPKHSQTDNITRYAKFEMDDKDTWVAIKRTTDLNLINTWSIPVQNGTFKVNIIRKIIFISAIFLNFNL